MLILLHAAVYGVGDGSSGPLSLIKKIQSVLHKLAGISQELNSFLGARFQGTSSRTSKVASRLILSYHRVRFSRRRTMRSQADCIVRRAHDSAVGNVHFTEPSRTSPLRKLMEHSRVIVEHQCRLGDERDKDAQGTW